MERIVHPVSGTPAKTEQCCSINFHLISEVNIKRIGCLIKETSDKIVIVNYIKITLSTSTEIMYADRNRRSLNTTVQLYARYSTI